MKKYFVTYATERFYEAEANSVLCAKESKFDFIYPKRPSDIAPLFYKANRFILDQKQHAGCCLWKPYFILDTMLKMDDGDFLLYMDCADGFNTSLLPLILGEMDSRGIFLVETLYLNKDFTRRNCFKKTGCDSEKYWYGHQVEAGCVGLIKNGFTLRFVNTWLKYCTVPDIIIDMGSLNTGEENLQGYWTHKCDQSVLSLMAIKHGIKTTHCSKVDLNCINYNQYKG